MTSGETERLLRSLGALVVAAGQIELRVPLLAAALLGIERQRVGIYLFGRQNTARGLEAIGEALQVTPGCEAKEQATSWLNQVRSAYQRRNTVIHGTFGNDEDGQLGSATLSRSLTGLAVETSPVDLTAIEGLIAELVRLTDEFDKELCSRLIADLPHTRAMLGHPA